MKASQAIICSRALDLPPTTDGDRHCYYIVATVWLLLSIARRQHTSVILTISFKMSKVIDYSKWDHVVDSSDEETEKAQVVTHHRIDRTRGIESPQKANTTDTKQASMGDLHMVRSLIASTIATGNVLSLSTKDLLPASVLLSAVTPKGIKERALARAEKQELQDDPVLCNLWNLTMKIRDGPEEVEELLKVNGIDRILAVISSCNLDKYNKYKCYNGDVGQSFMTLGETPSEADKALAKQLSADIKDIVSSISVLHEMCRFRNGAVALAKHKKCLTLLFNLPSDKICSLGSSLMSKFLLVPFGDPIVSSDTFFFGHMEQATIDTFGRVLNGLDEHALLRKETAKMLRAGIDEYEARLQSILLFFQAHEDVAPVMNHCLDLKSSLSKLRKMLSKPDNYVKGWRSTFRLERQYVPNKKSGDMEGDGETQKCRNCSIKLDKLQTCSRW